MAQPSAPPTFITEERPKSPPVDRTSGAGLDFMLGRLGDLAAMIARAGPIDDIIKKGLADIADLFGIGEIVIEVTAREVKPYFHWGTYGIPVNRARPLVDNLSNEYIDQPLLDSVISEKFRITDNAYYVPGEEWLAIAQSDPFLDHPAYYRRPELLRVPREKADDWHEADSYKFTLRDNGGEMIGVVEASYPDTGRLLPRETVEQIELFVEMISIAVSRERSRIIAARRSTTDSHKADLLEDVLKIASSIVSERDLRKLSDMILSSVSSLFEFARVSLVVYDDVEGVFRWKALFGYSQEAERSVENRTMPVDVVFEDLAEAKKIGKSVYFTRVEQMTSRQRSFSADPGGIPAAPFPPRKKDEMRNGDFLAFPLHDSAGRVVGVIYPSEPTDGKLPDEYAIETIEIFASLAEVAMENARLTGEREQALRLSSQRTEQLSRILDLATGIMYVRNLDQMLDNILKTLARLLGIRRMVVGVKDAAEGIYRIEAVYGYSTKAAESIKKVPYPIWQVDGIVDARGFMGGDSYSRWWEKIGRMSYYAPAEGLRTLEPDEMAYYPDHDLIRLPRAGKGRWHELDYIDTIIPDKSGVPIAYMELLKPRDDRIPDPETIEIIEIFASLAGIAIENAKMFQEHIDSRDNAELYTDVLSHDIKNFNQAILGYLELLKTKVDSPEKLAIIDKIGEQVMNTNWLASNVRTMSRVTFGDVELVRTDLGSVLLDCIRSVSQYYPGRRITVHQSIERSTHFMKADELVRELFTNILTNAVKYDPHDPLEIDASLDAVSRDNKKYWLVSIADHGRGVSDELKPIIFDRFSRAPRKKGSGMGLHIVKTLAKRYGGRVWIEDRVQGDHSQGAVFKVELPAMD